MPKTIVNENLTLQNKLDIIEAVEKGETQQAVAIKFNVDKSTVCRTYQKRAFIAALSQESDVNLDSKRQSTLKYP